MVKMRTDPLLRESVARSDIVVADGMSVVWASRILSESLPARVNGTNVFEKLLALANRESFGVFFLGAERRVLDVMVERIRGRYPGIRVAGSQDGFFAESEAQGIADKINRARADMLFVGMSSPKKELFMARFGGELNVAIVHGVGGSFDVLAGKVKRAPVSWQNAGLEWLYRLLQEPGRMWRRYLVTNPAFCWWVLTAWIHSRTTGRRHSRL